MKILGIIITLLLLFTLVACETTSKPTLVTHDCTDHTTTSLKAQGEVEDIGAGLLSRRGFVYMEGTEGGPELDSIPLVNPSFEEGDPPEGWTYRNSNNASRVSNPVKSGSYALKYEYSKDTPYGFAYTGLFDREQWAGKDITVAAWCKTDVSATVRIECQEWGGTWHRWAICSYHPGDSEWHLLIGSGTVPGDLAYNFTIMVGVAISRTWDCTFYVDGVVALEGRAVFEDGEFDIGTYSLTIDDLEPDTSYRVRAFGENEAGMGYGNTVSCETL